MENNDMIMRNYQYDSIYSIQFIYFYYFNI